MGGGMETQGVHMERAVSFHQENAEEPRFPHEKFSPSVPFQPQLSVILPDGLVRLGWTTVWYLLPLGILMCRKMYKNSR